MCKGINKLIKLSHLLLALDIKIDNDVFPVPPIKMLPTQIVLIVNFFLCENFLKKLIV